MHDGRWSGWRVCAPCGSPLATAFPCGTPPMSCRAWPTTFTVPKMCNARLSWQVGSRIMKWRTRAASVACALVLGALFSGRAPGQEAAGARSGQTATAPENSPQDTGLTLRVDTTLVQIPVAVTDSVNRFVLGLQKDDFHLLE